MGNVTIRNVPDEVHTALKLRAVRHQRSTEAEMRAILTAAVSQETGNGLVQQMRSAWSGHHGSDFDDLRDPSPVEGATFE